MNVVSSGYNYTHPKDFYIDRPNGSPEFVLITVRSPAYFIMNGNRLTTDGNAVVVYKKGTPQLYGALDCEFVNDWVHFSLTEEEERWLLGLGIELDSVIDFSGVTQISSLIRNLTREKYSSGKNAEDEAELYLRLLLMKVSDLAISLEKANKSLLFDRFLKIRDEIYSNPAKKWNVQGLADETSVSLSYFQHLYKEFFGCGVKRDIIISRMEYARYLLSSADYTVGAIALLSGYDSEVHFMRAFKERYGVTPTHYRQCQSKK